MSATKEGNGEDSSDSETEQMRRAKQIPTWARSANLPQSLVAETRDPDSIFDKVNTINLEEVFEGHPTKRRFRARTSSGMWVRDRLTAREELDYKKMTTGFDASMPPPPPPPPPPPSGSGGAGASGV
jgi:Inner centromere protein, ARK binding region